MRMAHFSRPALGSTSRTCIEVWCICRIVFEGKETLVCTQHIPLVYCIMCSVLHYVPLHVRGMCLYSTTITTSTIIPSLVYLLISIFCVYLAVVCIYLLCIYTSHFIYL